MSLPKFISMLVTFLIQGEAAGPVGGGGLWSLLLPNIGVPAMHMQLLHSNEVMIYDRMDVGPSNLTLPGGSDNHCRFDALTRLPDCTAHSAIYDVLANTVRPLFLQTDVWCSSAAVLSDGTLIQTGGFRAKGEVKVRSFRPCKQCQWIEDPVKLNVKRWYASDQILPDGRIIVIGGDKANSFEYFPKDPSNMMDLHPLPFLDQAKDLLEGDNLYPFIHLMPDGNVFIFANRRSILLDHRNNRVIKEYPEIPGEARNYPCIGSSVLLPLYLSQGGGQPPAAEVMVCGGAKAGNSLQPKGVFLEAARSCGRLRVTDPNPQWVMEEMPIPRTMGDMIVLPNGNVLIINGAKNGTAKWESADEPAFNPVLYKPDEPDGSKRFVVMNPSTIPRMYHSVAVLLHDGRVLVGGSNPHQYNTFTATKFPTELRLEAFSPHYLDPRFNHLRPSIVTDPKNTTNPVYSYGQEIPITVMWVSDQEEYSVGEIKVVLVYPAFSTHSNQMNQRLLVLPILSAMELSKNLIRVLAIAPETPNVAPAGYYMLFVVNRGVPSQTSVWVRIG